MPSDAARRARRGPDTVEILRLEIRLDRVEPTVSRVVDLRASSSLATLHGAIQAAMGWYDCHLHEFRKDGARRRANARRPRVNGSSCAPSSPTCGPPCASPRASS